MPRDNKTNANRYQRAKRDLNKCSYSSCNKIINREVTSKCKHHKEVHKAYMKEWRLRKAEKQNGRQNV